MTEQEIKDAILGAISAGDPACDCDRHQWHFFLVSESESNAARLDFASAVITRLKESQCKASYLDSPTAISLRQHPFEVDQ